LARFRAEQPPYSILNRGVEREVLPACQRYGMGVMAWSPLAMGALTGRYRKGQQPPDSLRARHFPGQMSDERRLDAVEQLIPVAAEAGLSLTHMALAFVASHPGVTSAILGPRTMEQLDDLLAGAKVVLDDAVLDRIDAIVPPGNRRRTASGGLQSACDYAGGLAPPADRRTGRRMTRPGLRPA